MTMKKPETIALDLTPKWETVAKIYISFLKNGNKMQKEVAEEDIMKMARLADAYVNLVKKKG